MEAATRVASILLVCCTGAAPAASQVPEATAGASGFGIEDNQVVTIPYSAFHPAFPSQSFVSSDFALGGMLATDWVHDSALAYLIAPLDAGLVPNGARITGFAAYVKDDDGASDANIRVELCRNWVDAGGQNPGFDCPYDLHSAGSPGDDVLVSSDDLELRYRFDVDTDGTDEVVGYTLRVTFGIDTKLAAYDGFDLRLRQVRIFFKRQTSPPPSVATFSDVTLSHPQSLSIEAFAASGVSQGCGGGRFCPDNPVTRAQLAMFLARALGLHWPAVQ